jgi:hypothetical protein
MDDMMHVQQSWIDEIEDEVLTESHSFPSGLAPTTSTTLFPADREEIAAGRQE